jgi:hypothetical protein
VIVTTPAEESGRTYRDMDFLEAVKREVAEMGEIPSLEDVRKMASVDPTPWADAVIADREDRSALCTSYPVIGMCGYRD